MMRNQRLINGELRIVESPYGEFPCIIVGPAFDDHIPFVQVGLPLFFGLWPECCFATRKQAEAERERLQQLESLSLLGEL